MSTAPGRSTQSPGEPAWQIATLYPAQGHWSEQEYLDLNTNRLVEFVDGFVAVLPLPTMSHQCVLGWFVTVLNEFVTKFDLGIVVMAAFAMRLGKGKFRTPDVLFMRTEHANRMHDRFWEGADLVLEVVSEDRRHDLETKRAEYAEAGIPE